MKKILSSEIKIDFSELREQIKEVQKEALKIVIETSEVKDPLIAFRDITTIHYYDNLLCSKFNACHMTNKKFKVEDLLAVSIIAFALNHPLMQGNKRMSFCVFTIQLLYLYKNWNIDHSTKLNIDKIIKFLLSLEKDYIEFISSVISNSKLSREKKEVLVYEWLNVTLKKLI